MNKSVKKNKNNNKIKSKNRCIKVVTIRETTELGNPFAAKKYIISEKGFADLKFLYSKIPK